MTRVPPFSEGDIVIAPKLRDATGIIVKAQRRGDTWWFLVRGHQNGHPAGKDRWITATLLERT